MLTCTAVDKALTCLSGYFKAGDKCTPCESTTTTITCESATVSTKCKNGYFLDATTKKCTACG